MQLLLDRAQVDIVELERAWRGPRSGGCAIIQGYATLGEVEDGSMARVLIASTPLLGHIAPLAPIAAELVCAGHDVVWYTGKHWRKRVESTGATFLPMRFAEDLSLQPVNERFPERASRMGIHSLLFDIRHIFAAPTVGYLLDLQEHLKTFPAEVVLSDSAFLAGRWLYELGGPPWAVLNPFTVNLSGANTPPFGLGARPASSRFGSFRVRLQQILGERYLYRQSTRYVDRLRQRVGLQPTGELFWDHACSPFLYMQGSIRGLEYPRDDLPPQFHYIGPSIAQDRPQPFDPPKWWERLESGKSVVLITQGTLSNDPEQLLFPALQALANDDVLLIGTTGGLPVEQLPGDTIPSNAHVERFIPFDHLLPHVDVMVTNGGYNGVQMALSHGVPLVVAGATEDKLEVNARVDWTGVGVDLRTAAPTPKQLQRAIRHVLDDGRFVECAKAMQQEFQQQNGAVTGARLVARLIETGQPVAHPLA
jgi:MGT family glycosyltransferase